MTVDFLIESMENGAVGFHVNDLRYISREDGSFDDGGQTPISSSALRREYTMLPFSYLVTDIIWCSVAIYQLYWWEIVKIFSLTSEYFD